MENEKFDENSEPVKESPNPSESTSSNADNVAAPNNILDDYILPYSMDEAFLREQQMLYAQLSGAVQADAATIHRQQEALAKLGISSTDNSNSDTTNTLPNENTSPSNPSQPQFANRNRHFLNFFNSNFFRSFRWPICIHDGRIEVIKRYSSN